MVKAAGKRSGTGNALALVFSYGYNADGLLDSMTRPNGSIVQTSYTARNQIDQILVDGAPPVVDYTYNLRGLMTGKTYESGGLATTISHDAKGQVLAVTHTSNFGTLDQLGYGYDPVGQRTYMQRVDGRGDLYGYDNARQVTATKLDIDSPSTGGIGVPAKDLSYAYDPGGNRSQTIDGGLATGYTANDVNEYTLVGADVPVYDNNGNLTSGNGLVMAWDAHNRLLSVVPATPVDGDLRAFYRYDGSGRRISKIVDKYDAGLAQWVAEQTRTFGYDGWNMVREGVVDTSTGAVETQVKSYTWGVDLSGSPQGAGGVGGLLMVEEDNDPSNPVSPITAYYYTNDANGNVTTVADSAGNPVAQYEYDPYGKVVVSAGVYADDNPYRFSTKFEDSESGWSYFGYRYYSPQVGRWVSRDPIYERGGFNMYAFVQNSPTRWVDFLGLCPPNDDADDPIYKPTFEDVNNGYPATRVTKPEQGFDNCWSYACNRTGSGANQPGELDPDTITCPKLISAAKDSGGKDPDEKGCCPKGYHKVDLRLGTFPGIPGKDYHALRENQDGCWSHFVATAPKGVSKQTETNTDASGNKITDPSKADFDYTKQGGGKYDESCGTICMPN